MINTHYLTDIQLKSYMDKLIQRKEQLIESIKNKKSDAMETYSEESDPLDAASNLESRRILLSEIDRDTSSVTKIVSVIKSFDDYGYCVDCGDEVGIKRLDFNPSSTRCFCCQDEKEKNDKHIYKKNM